MYTTGDQMLDNQRQEELRRLEHEQEQLRVLVSQIDTHAGELAVSLRSKLAHVHNISSLTQSFALARQAGTMLEEALTGSEHQMLMTKIEEFRVRVRSYQQQVTARLDDLRSGSGSANSAGINGGFRQGDWQ